MQRSQYLKRRLRWHYRSQHEMLIAFNHFFYNDDLVVFPSPEAQSSDFGLQSTHLKEGTFVNRRNTAEATAVSEANALARARKRVLRRQQDEPEPERAHRSGHRQTV